MAWGEYGGTFTDARGNPLEFVDGAWQRVDGVPMFSDKEDEYLNPESAPYVEPIAPVTEPFDPSKVPAPDVPLSEWSQEQIDYQNSYLYGPEGQSPFAPLEGHLENYNSWTPETGGYVDGEWLQPLPYEELEAPVNPHSPFESDGEHYIWDAENEYYIQDPAYAEPRGADGLTDAERARAQEAIDNKAPEESIWNPIDNRPYEEGENTDWTQDPRYLAGELDPEKFPSQPYIKANPNNVPQPVDNSWREVPEGFPDDVWSNPYPVTNPYGGTGPAEAPEGSPSWWNPEGNVGTGYDYTNPDAWNPPNTGGDFTTKPSYDFGQQPNADPSNHMLQILRQQGNQIVKDAPQQLATALRSGFQKQ